jgi:hypothetical protein
MSDINMLRERLDQIGNEAGHLQVDLGRARVRGRRILRMRRAATAAGSAAMIGVVVVAVAVAGRAAPPGHPAGNLPPASAAAPPAAQLVRTAAFGWLPAGLSADSYVADSQSRPYFEVDAGTAGGLGPVIILTDYGHGPQPALPDLPGGVPATLIPAARVNGHRAYWITAPTTAPNAQLNFELRWQYAPDKWADLQAAGLPAPSVAGLTRVAYKIAATAALGGRSVIALPIGVAGIPPGLRVRRAALDTVTSHGPAVVGPARGGALIFFAGSKLAPSDSIQFSVSPTGLVKHHRVDGPRAFDRRRSGTGQGPTPASDGVATNTVIDGHPAYDSQLDGQAGTAILWVFGVHGFDVQIEAGPSALAAMPRSHDLIWLFSHMTVSHMPVRT